MSGHTADAFTVIVPLFNGERFITDTLDSLAAQTLPLAEVIVVDDGSSDGGVEIAANHVVAPRIVRQRNAGVAVARNRGALIAATRWIAFLDQDDLWLKNRHERLSGYVRSNPDVRALVTTESRFCLESDLKALGSMSEGLHRLPSCRRVESAAEMLEMELPAGGLVTGDVVSTLELLSGTVTVTTSYLFDRELFLSAGGCATFARSLDDYWALLNLSRLTDIVRLDDPTVAYRIHPTSTTMETEWPRPLLSSQAAARLGDILVPLRSAHDGDSVPPLMDERGFWLHQLLALARTPGGYLDALAFARLLGAGRADTRRALRALTRARAGASVRRMLQRRGAT
jgi:glycosyltransferase involved in cell wall biosynthesis